MRGLIQLVFLWDLSDRLAGGLARGFAHALGVLLVVVLASVQARAQDGQPTSRAGAVAVAAPAGAKQPSTATFGIAVRDLYGINFPEQTFAITFYLWVSTPSDVDESRLDFFDLENAQEWSRTLLTRTLADGRVVSLYDCRAVARKRWTVVDYPFDEHTLRLFFQVRPDLAAEWTIDVDQAGSTLAPDLRISGWDVDSLNIRAATRTFASGLGGAAQTSTGAGGPATSLPECVVEISISRPLGGLGLFFRTFVCLVVAVTIGFMSFYVSVEAVDVRAELCVGALFAAVGSQFVVNDLLPDSTSATLSDRLHIIVYLAIFATLCISVLLERMHRRVPGERPHRLNRIARKVVPICTAVLFAGLSLFYAFAEVHATP